MTSLATKVSLDVCWLHIDTYTKMLPVSCLLDFVFGESSLRFVKCFDEVQSVLCPPFNNQSFAHMSHSSSLCFARRIHVVHERL